MSPSLIAFLLFLSLATAAYAMWGMPISTEALIERMRKRPLLPGEIRANEALPMNPDSGNAKLAKRVSKLSSIFKPKNMSTYERSEMNSKILVAGNPFNVSDASEQRALQFAFAAVFSIAGLLVCLMFSLVPVAGIVIGAAIGYALPPLTLKQETKKRSQAMKKMLPEALDLLSVSMKAGLSFVPAIQAVAKNMPESVIKEEFGTLASNVGSGMRLNDSLSKLGERFESPELDAFVKAVSLSQKTGSDIVDILSKQSEYARQAYESDIAEKASKLEGKIMILMIPFEVPAFTLMFLITPIYQMTSGGAGF